VQRTVDQAEDFVKDKAPEVAEFIADGAKTVVAKAAGKQAPARKSGTGTSSSGTSKSSASK
jgi:hypothetical protein